MFIFFVYPKKTNQKKGLPITWFRAAELPCAARKDRALRNSLRLYPLAGCSDSPRAIPTFSVLLGCVIWLIS